MREGAPVQVMSRGAAALTVAFYHFKIHHADSQLTRRVAKDIPFVGGLRIRRNDNQRIAARRIVEMQRVVETSLARVRICSLLPTRTGIGLLAFGP